MNLLAIMFGTLNLTTTILHDYDSYTLLITGSVIVTIEHLICVHLTNKN